MEVFTRKEKFEILKQRKRVAVTLCSMLAVMSGVAFLYGDSVTRTAQSEEVAFDYKSEFIRRVAGHAQELGIQNDLYPSVMIAQAIHESAYGTSGLSLHPYNNLFGVKGDYLGQSVTMRTWEDDGLGNAYHIDAPFRMYPSVRESLQDYVAVVKQPWFSNVWRSNTSSYRDATLALTGTYATDTTYADKLNYLIEVHGLTAYDTVGTTVTTSVWNGYRGSYTDQATLEIDKAFAQRLGIEEAHPQPAESTTSVSEGASTETGLVWNEYRRQYTTQEVLDTDNNWASMNGN